MKLGPAFGHKRSGHPTRLATTWKPENLAAFGSASFAPFPTYQGDEEDSKILGVFEHVAVFTGIDISERISSELCLEFAAI